MLCSVIIVRMDIVYYIRVIISNFKNHCKILLKTKKKKRLVFRYNITASIIYSMNVNP